MLVFAPAGFLPPALPPTAVRDGIGSRRRIWMGEFPERLRRLRERNRLSRYRLSELCGISSDQIRRYELGNRKPGTDALEAIADYFEVSTDYLLGRTDYPCVVKPLSSHKKI
jgi:ribosome-binding protein aMBF1 (putative translation factor)